METARPFSSGEALQVKKPIFTDVLGFGFRVSGFGSKPENQNTSLSVTRNKKLGIRNCSFSGNLGVSNGDAQRQASLHIKLCRSHQEIVMQVNRREGEARPLKECPGLPPTARRPLINNRLQRMGN